MAYSGMAAVVAGFVAFFADLIFLGSAAIGGGSLLIMSAIVGAWWNDE
jgi:hypothetical protein